jgi:hypothetical protein
VVRGLDTFRNHFADFKDKYVLIGGAASSELMAQSGLEFRATVDLDIVLIVEALTPDFVRAFWDFIRHGKYGSRSQSQNERKYYRFEKPEAENYPKCIELFSRIPDGISFEGQGTFTPIPVEEDLSSLSAILLDDDYYPLIMKGKIDIDGLSCLKAEYIIILKAKAWLDMTKRKENGERIDSRNIKKHKSDIFWLFPVLEPDLKIELPESVKEDLAEYFDVLEKDTTINLANYKIRRINLQEIVSRFKQLYDLR